MVANRVDIFALYTSSWLYMLPIRGNCLDRGSGDEEPLVNAWVNRGRSLVVASRNVKLAWVGALRGVRDSGVGATILSVL